VTKNWSKGRQNPFKEARKYEKAWTAEIAVQR